jgi:ribonuclease D
MTDVNLVTEKAALDELVGRLSKAPRIACDTEAASFHRYRDRVFLIQLSSDDETAIVDPLALADLSGIGKILNDPAIEIVFHDADFDLRSLYRDYEWDVNNVFDTRVAAQLIGEPAIGLGALLEKYFDIKVDKRFQRADWSKRPLDPEMIDYAAGDTSHLLGLRDKIEQNLIKLGRIDWAREEFANLTNVRWEPEEDPIPRFLKLKGIRGFNTSDLGILKTIFEWRENEAQSLDKPPFRILANQSLLDIAKANPTNPQELLAAGVPRNSVKRYGTQMVTAAQKGSTTPYTDAKRPNPRKRIHPAGDGVVDALKDLRNTISDKLGIEPGVLCPNGTLQAIARATPKTEGQLGDVSELRNWQTGALGGTKILELVNK